MGEEELKGGDLRDPLGEEGREATFETQHTNIYETGTWMTELLSI